MILTNLGKPTDPSDAVTLSSYHSSSSDVNVNAIEILNKAEKSIDLLMDNALITNSEGNYNANQRRIVNLSAPVDYNDAVNLFHLLSFASTIKGRSKRNIPDNTEVTLMQLYDEIFRLIELINALQTSITTHHDFIRKTEAELLSTTNRLSVSDLKLNKNTQDIKSLNEKLMQAGVETINKLKSQLENLQTEYTAEISRFDQRFDQVQTAVEATLDARLSQHKFTENALQTLLTEISDTQTKLKAELDRKYVELNANLNDNIGDIKAQTNALQDEMHDLNTAALKNINEAIETIKGILNARTVVFNDTNKSIIEGIDKNSSKHRALQKDFNKLKEEIQQIISNNDVKYSEINNKLTGFDSQGINNELSKLNTARLRMRSDFTKLQDKLEKQTQLTAELNTKLASEIEANVNLNKKLDDEIKKNEDMDEKLRDEIDKTTMAKIDEAFDKINTLWQSVFPPQPPKKKWITISGPVSADDLMPTDSYIRRHD